MASPDVKCRRFVLIRDEDVSGVSGTGKVAEGVEFDNGICVVSFISPYPHANTYFNLHVLEAVHGHGGKTKVVFVD